MNGAAVRAMTVHDIEGVRAIGVDAGERFRAVADRRIASCADDLPWTAEELQRYVQGRRAWVATEAGTVVGYAIVDIVDGAAHVEEIDVARRAGRRGHGGRLLAQVVGWARASGWRAVTLTTFRDVPWNAPWYLRRGFRPVDGADLTPELRALRDREDSQGLPAELRVVLQLDLARGETDDEP